MPLSGHDDVALLNGVVNDAESTQKSKNHVMIVNLKSETIGKLINRIPGSRLSISSLQGSALRMLVELVGQICNNFKKNRAFYDKSMKLGTCLVDSNTK